MRAQKGQRDNECTGFGTTSEQAQSLGETQDLNPGSPNKNPKFFNNQATPTSVSSSQYV